MKHISKKQTEFRSLSNGMLLACMVLLGAIMPGCSNDNDISLEYETEYLDFNVYNYTRPFTEDEILILNKAFIRIEDYIVFDDESIKININHKDINISERLYNYLLLCNFSAESIAPIRLKDGGVEMTYGTNFVMKEVNISHNEIMTLMNGMQSDYSHIGYASAIAAWFPGAAFSAFIIGTKSYLEGLAWSGLENNYIASGSTTGAKLVELTIYSPTGMSYTSHQLVFN